MRGFKDIVEGLVCKNLRPIIEEDAPWIDARAQEMRALMTPAERLLWERLRDGQRGYVCEPQVVIDDRYIADFVMPGTMLIVEIDGKTHEGREEYDWQRTYYLLDKGYDLRRFANQEVYRNIEDVLARIDRAVFELVCKREVKEAAA